MDTDSKKRSNVVLLKLLICYVTDLTLGFIYRHVYDIGDET